MKIDPNAPAYPTGEELDRNLEISVRKVGGMTIRTQIAAMAMQGLLAQTYWTSTQLVAEYAVDLADALIAELNKEAP